MQLTGWLVTLDGMQRDAQRTRRQILAAATEEFAERGIAGARVDRIATVAGCNKAMLYAYYGSKDGLFDAVFTEYVELYLAQAGFDAEDLPTYAGRVFDYFERNPGHLRLATWYRLERPESTQLEAVVAVNAERLTALQQAQTAGKVPAELSPVALLSLIQSIATSWSTMNPEYNAALPARAQRRQAVVRAVELLLHR
jgi:AcrR family transcriptional regulator